MLWERQFAPHYVNHKFLKVKYGDTFQVIYKTKLCTS